MDVEDEDDNLVWPDEDEPPPNGPWRDGALWVLDGKCKTCIFRPGNLMKLAPGRVESMVEACVRENTIIPCHKTLDGPRSVCRGLYDVHYGKIAVLQVADRLGLIKFDSPPA